MSRGARENRKLPNLGTNLQGLIILGGIIIITAPISSSITYLVISINYLRENYNRKNLAHFLGSTSLAGLVAFYGYTAWLNHLPNPVWITVGPNQLKPGVTPPDGQSIDSYCLAHSDQCTKPYPFLDMATFAVGTLSGLAGGGIYRSIDQLRSLPLEEKLPQLEEQPDEEGELSYQQGGSINDESEAKPSPNIGLLVFMSFLTTPISSPAILLYFCSQKLLHNFNARNLLHFLGALGTAGGSAALIYLAIANSDSNYKLLTAGSASLNPGVSTDGDSVEVYCAQNASDCTRSSVILDVAGAAAATVSGVAGAVGYLVIKGARGLYDSCCSLWSSPTPQKSGEGAVSLVENPGSDYSLQ